MRSRFLFVLLFLLTVTAAAAQDLSYPDFSWQTIGKGLNFTRIEVLDKQTLVECLEVVRIDPNLNSFRSFTVRRREFRNGRKTPKRWSCLTAVISPTRGNRAGLC